MLWEAGGSVFVVGGSVFAPAALVLAAAVDAPEPAFPAEEPQPERTATTSRQLQLAIILGGCLTPVRLAGASPHSCRYAEDMRDEATAVEIRTHIRLLHGMRRPANWLQLVRFGMVGGVGFVVNLVVYALVVHYAGVDYRVASVVAWLVAVINNFVLNRHWTFDARAGRAHFQALRFFVVSLAAEGFSLLLLTGLVEGVGIAKLPAQALAVAASMPLNFLGNKLWSFRA